MSINSASLYELIGIPKVHWDAAIASIPSHLPYKNRLERIANGIVTLLPQGGGIFFFGPYSAGKSANAAILLKAALRFRIVGAWVRHSDLAGIAINKVMYDESTSMMEHILTVPILVIDEILIREHLGYTEYHLEDLVRKRIDEKLFTVLTTNLTESVFRQKYPAFAACLEGTFEWFPVAGYNFRKKERTQ